MIRYLKVYGVALFVFLVVDLIWIRKVADSLGPGADAPLSEYIYARVTESNIRPMY